MNRTSRFFPTSVEGIYYCNQLQLFSPLPSLNICRAMSTMALPQQETKDVVSAKVLKQLSNTRYACSSLEQLSTRPGNFVYRGVLSQPFTTQDGTVATRIIIKHSTETVVTGQDSPRNAMRCVIMNAPSPYTHKLDLTSHIC